MKMKKTTVEIAGTKKEEIQIITTVRECQEQNQTCVVRKTIIYGNLF